MKLTFHGGVKMVTGANYLLESNGVKILIDCGLHQGGNFCEKHNWEPFPYNPGEIEAVFITHAHIDHTGRLPKLVKDGFHGMVYATHPTRDASELLLQDADHILAQEAERFRLPPLFMPDDVTALMKRWQGVEYHEPVTVGPFTVSFYNAGHILGSSFIVIEAEHKRIVFSGDLGNTPAPIIGDKEFLDHADYCLVESTYGNRLHEALPERKEILEDLIEDTVTTKGVLMIPAFAMERTQELLYEMNDLVEHGRVPKVPVFIDSPLAIKLIDVYKKYERYFSPEAKSLIAAGETFFDFPGLQKTISTEESKSINGVPAPKVVIAGSGMSHGGRILHHERRYLPDHNSTLLIVGYQSKGSLGRALLDGEKQVRIMGEEVTVRCHLKAIGGYSAHADQKQLTDWVTPMRKNLRKVFVVQGEEESSQALAQLLIDKFAVDAHIPAAAQEVVL